MYEIEPPTTGTYFVVESGPPLGVPMNEIEISRSIRRRRAYTIVECTRRDCEIRAYCYNDGGAGGPCELLPEWAYLIDEAPVTTRR